MFSKLLFAAPLALALMAAAPAPVAPPAPSLDAPAEVTANPAKAKTLPTNPVDARPRPCATAIPPRNGPNAFATLKAE